MKKILGIIFYIISILLLLFYIGIDLNNNIMLSTSGRLVLLIGSSIGIYIGGILMSKHLNNNKLMIKNLYIFFILYLILFLTLTLFDPMWNRVGISISSWSIERLKNYIKYSFNIIPFKTIFDYIKRIFMMNISLNIVLVNLVGNFVCLMPLGLFASFVKKMSNKKFLLISTIFVFMIEVIQFATISGSCDIDDVILNVLGAFIMFKLARVKCISDLLHNIFLLEKNKLDIKKLLKYVRIFVVALAILMGCYYIFAIKYNNDLDKMHNFTIKIVDENEVCAEALEKFYEDRFHEYYFSCIKSDSVYAVINNEKYLVKDLLNNNQTDYLININRLEAAGLEFITKDKYPSFTVNYKDYGTLEFKIDNEDLIEIVLYSSISNEDNSLEEKFYVIPKTNGTTNFKVLYDKNEENYEVNINDGEATLTKID